MSEWNWRSDLHYFKAAGIVRLSVLLFMLLCLALLLSWYSKSWEHVSRVGGIITIIGLLQTVRRLGRLGPVGATKPKPPMVINNNEFNMEHVYASMEETTDNYAQILGIYVVVLGTILWSYGDFILERLLPFGT